MKSDNRKNGDLIPVGEEMDSILPVGWTSALLRDILLHRKGKKPKRLEDARWDGSVPYIDIEAFETGRIRRYADPDSSVIVEKDDVVIVWDGARCGHAGKAPARGALGSTLMALTSTYLVEGYLLRILQSLYEAINTNPRGTGIPHVDPTLFWDLEIPIAPVEEQKRIVAKIEELLPKVNAVRERLIRVKEIMKRFRQSVLSAACSGHITEDWRERQVQNDVGQELLDEILAKRAERLSENTCMGVDKLCRPDRDQLNSLPEGWARASLDQLSCLVTSGSRGWAKHYSAQGPLFIRAQNINRDYLCLDEIAHVNPPADAEGRRTRIEEGDILITITGANVTKSALVKGDIGEGYVSQHVAIVRPVEIQTGPFLYLWIISPSHGRAKLIDDAYGAGKPGLNLSNLKEIAIGLPGLEEQKEIVKRADSLLEQADKIEKRVETELSRTAKMNQAILAKAFRGELIPTEAEVAG
jgi:type I restriction enzyme S subunit